MGHKQKEVGNFSEGRDMPSTLPLPSPFLADVQLKSWQPAWMLSSWIALRRIIRVKQGEAATPALVCHSWIVMGEGKTLPLYLSHFTVGLCKRSQMPIIPKIMAMWYSSSHAFQWNFILQSESLGPHKGGIWRAEIKQKLTSNF